MRYTHLVLAPTTKAGRQFVEEMGWRSSRVAIITDPEHLRGVAIVPNEIIYALKPIDPEFLTQLDICSNHLEPGEEFNLKIVS